MLLSKWLQRDEGEGGDGEREAEIEHENKTGRELRRERSERKG